MNPFYAIWYYLKTYKELIISIFLICLFVLFIAACGDDDINKDDIEAVGDS